MNPDTTTYLDVNPYQQVLNGMTSLLAARAGVITLTGATGTGKTALLRQLVTMLRQDRHHALLLEAAPHSIDDLQRIITRELGLPANCVFSEALSRHIENLPENRPRLTLIFDNVDAIDVETFRFIAELRGSISEHKPQPGIVLCGSPALRVRLAEPDFKPLLDDGLDACTLEPMTRKQLLAFCITWMASQQEIFKINPGMLNAIATSSGNLPGAVPAVLQKLSSRIAAPVPAFVPTLSPAFASDSTFDSDPVWVDLDAEPVSDSLDTTPDIAIDTLVAETAPASAATAVPVSDEALHLATPTEPVEHKRQPPARPILRYIAIAASVLVAAGLAWTAFSPQADSPAIDESLTSDAAAPPETPAASALTTDENAVATPAPALVTTLPEEHIADPAVTVADAISSASPADNTQTAAPSSQQQTTQDESPAPANADPAVVTPPADIANTRQQAGMLAPTSTDLANTGDAAALEAIVRDWLDAWQKQDVTAFFEHYHTDFAPADDSTLPVWRDERQNRISRPGSISIGLQEFTVGSSSPLGTWVSFWMTYRSPAYADRTRKEILIGPDVDGEWRILQELNRQIDVIARTEIAAPVDDITAAAPAQTSASSASAEPAATAREVADFLNAWLASWENQDPDAYFLHYAPDFSTAGTGSPENWRNDRTAKITRPDSIQLTLQNMDVLESSADGALVELLLEYQANDYADRTVKEMRLARNARGDWLITQEINRQVEQLPLPAAFSAETLTQP